MPQTETGEPDNLLKNSPFALESPEASVFNNTSFAQVLINYWQAAIRWKWLIASIVIASIVVGTIATMLQPRLYNASSQIQIGRSKRVITKVESLQPDDFSDEFYNTQYTLLKARSLALRVARDLKLADNSSFLAANGIKLDGTSDGSHPLSATARQNLENRAAGLLLGGISIRPERNSSLVNISYTSQSPEWSARIANAWPRQFIAANIDRQIAASADARRYLEDRLANLRNRMNLSEQALINFGSDRNIVTLGATRDTNGKTEEPRTLVANNLEALAAALIAAKTERIAAESRANSTAKDTSTDVIASATISSLRAKRSDLNAEYAKLLVQFEPGYPGARAIRGQIDVLDRAIAAETARINASRQTSFVEAAKRETELEHQVKDVKAEFDQQQRDTIQMHVYQREVDTNRQLFDSLLQRYKDIGIAGDVGADNIVIVDDAKVPGGPSSPDLSHNMLLSIIIGLVVAGGAVFAFETIGEGIRFPGDVERLINLPLIGATPLIDGQPVAKLLDPKSQLAEAYFSIRTTLGLATSHGLPKSLVITSAQPGEGKSTTALGLAIAIGVTGKRVLLIDGDLRSPSLAKLLGYDNTRGFSNILAGHEDYLSFVHTCDSKNLFLMPSGPSPLSPVELLSADRLISVLRALGQHFDHIVIDSPPVVGIADALLLGRAVECSVLVIQAEGAAIRIIRAALQRLMISHNHVLGAVVTKVNFGRFGYGYSYDYGYGGKTDNKKLAAE